MMTLVTVKCGGCELGVRQRVASIMNQSPLDGKVTQQVKMAANVIDRFGFEPLLPTYLHTYLLTYCLVIVLTCSDFHLSCSHCCCCQ